MDDIGSKKNNETDSQLNSIDVYKNKKTTYIVVITAVLCICFALSISVFDLNIVQNNNKSFYLRYLYPDQMAVANAMAEQYGADVYFDGLESDNIYDQYFSINKLVEYYNDDEVRKDAIIAIRPFVESEEEKLRQSSALALSLLEKTFGHPDIIRMSDGSLMFVLYKDYSDYGTYNVIWKIKDDELSKFYSFNEPSMYITSIVLSPDSKSIAVSTCSNKSEYVVIFDVENGMVSPELVDSARNKVAGILGYDMWVRIDRENYSGLGDIDWVDGNTVAFEAGLSFNGTEIVEDVYVTYDYLKKNLNVELLDRDTYTD